MKKPVSILVTWDVDPAQEVCTENMKRALEQTRCLLRDYKIPSTFFVPANMAEQFRGDIINFIPDGHEIGCHGLTHGNEEDYNRMPEDIQRKYLYEATDILRKSTGQTVHSFRGPHMKTSAVTQKILSGLGYIADCSVASQRVDFVSSNLINVSWIFAPRLPYRPSRRSAFRKGDQDICVVPPLGGNSAIHFKCSLHTEGKSNERPVQNSLYGVTTYRKAYSVPCTSLRICALYGSLETGRIIYYPKNPHAWVSFQRATL